MTAIGSLGAVIGRISAIEARLGIRPSAPPATATTAGSVIGGGPGAGGAAVDFGGLLEHTERATGPMTGRHPFAPAGVTAERRNGPSPFATAAPFTASAPAATAAIGVGTDTLPPGTPYRELFERAGATWGIPPQVLAAVGFVESSFRTDVVSPAGAQGLMQFMPATAASMGVDPWDPASAIDGAARLLRELQDRFGSLEVALGAYNVGPGTIARAGGGIVPGSQSEKYVAAVKTALEQYS